MDVPTIRAFIGIILNMGLVKKHGIESYWNVRNYSQDTPMYRKVFTKTTFKNILRFFHASDSDLEPMRGTDRYDPTYMFRHSGILQQDLDA